MLNLKMKWTVVAVVAATCVIFIGGLAVGSHLHGYFEGFPVVRVMVDGEEMHFEDTEAINFHGRTMVPVRFVSEELGADVKWDEDTWTVNVYKDTEPEREDEETIKHDIEPGEGEYGLKILSRKEGSVVLNGDTLLREDFRILEEGQEIEIKAFPAPAWEFSHWTGDISGADETVNLIVDRDMDIEAVFQRSEGNKLDVYNAMPQDTVGIVEEDGRYRLHLYVEASENVRIVEFQRLGYTYGDYNVLFEENPWPDAPDFEYSRFGTGFGFTLPRDDEGRRMTRGITDFYVVAETADGELLEGGTRVFLKEDAEPRPDYEPEKDDDRYDTQILRHKADFEQEVADGVHWVSAATVGEPQWTNDELKEMKGQPDVLRRNIVTLYDALHYLDVSGYETYSGNVRIDGDGGRWEHYEPGSNSLATNSGNCAATANAIVYLLSEDYQEVGHIFWLYPLGRGGHFMNYVKQDGYYYIFDASAYRDYLTASVETGALFHYSRSDRGTNIHRVTEDYLADYVEYYRSEGRSDIVFFGLIDRGDDLFPIDNRSQDDQHIRAVPYGYGDYVVEIFNADDAPVVFEEVEPPSRKPDIAKYHPSNCYEYRDGRSRFIGCE